MLTLAVSILLYFQSRPISHTREKAAFLPEGSTRKDGVTVRIKGDCVKSGVYQFDSAMSLGTVINMTVPFCQEFSRNQGSIKKIMYTGDVFLILCCNGKHVEITRDTMQVVEKMVLGIPLDPNSLTADEWEMLPRIGPTLARKIIADRQLYGDFLSTCDLERVPGIGSATVKQLEGYFVKKVMY
ncbi:MAG: helix-hairpin-helix domain-containing protein [Geobacteraceae bacterium]|nr:helix-hairpin-helix domain-containing protein [Geobacteraceae bacterium]